MNSNPLKSASPCRCDEGTGYTCREHTTSNYQGIVRPSTEPTPYEIARNKVDALHAAMGKGLFPDSAQGRKDHPVFTGVLMYFPDSFAAVSRVSKKGNDQHNPGEKLHWAREKSTDQMDTATRHMMDHGTGTTKDTDGEYHLAKAIWRLCAELQLTIEKERA